MTQARRFLHDLIHDRQHNRILRLSFPNNDAPASKFVVNRIVAIESLSRNFEFTVELLSDDDSVAFKEVQGKLINIELVIFLSFRCEYLLVAWRECFSCAF